MKKAWRVITVLVLTSFLLGAVCVGVGLMTGANWERTTAALERRYNIDFEQYYEAYSNWTQDAWVSISEAVF